MITLPTSETSSNNPQGASLPSTPSVSIQSPPSLSQRAERIVGIIALERINFNHDPHQDLAPLTDVKPIIKEVEHLLNSEVVQALAQSNATIRSFLNDQRTYLFHLNLTPEFDLSHKPQYTFLPDDYPYNAVFDAPFPKRPTFEFLNQFKEFLQLLEQANGGQSVAGAESAKSLIDSYEPLKRFSSELAERQTTFAPVSKDHSEIIEAIPVRDIIDQSVDSWIVMSQRLRLFGETAPFPEFAESVTMCLEALRNDPNIRSFAKSDTIFSTAMDRAIVSLEEVMRDGGDASALHPAFTNAFPYRRTIEAIEKAVTLFEMRERLSCPESNNWFDVERSQFPEQSGWEGPKLLLPRYHHDRYRYQEFGLLTNPNAIVMPWSAALSEEDLVRLRPTPLYPEGVTVDSIRVDRHHMTGREFKFHDVNHSRREWGYDRQLAETEGVSTFGELIASMRQRQSFVEHLLKATNIDDIKGDERDAREERQIRRLARSIIFETMHETALPATREALLNDLFRLTETWQPFEQNVQGSEVSRENQRTFDGNLLSGAGDLPLAVDTPTIVRYYFDRAPNFYNNVWNKNLWGFHRSVFVDRGDPDLMEFFTPENFVKATDLIFDSIGWSVEHRPSRDDRIRAVLDRTGQPELFNYFAVKQEDDISAWGQLLANRPPPQTVNRPFISDAREFAHSRTELSPTEISKVVYVGDSETQTLARLKKELENLYARLRKQGEGIATDSEAAGHLETQMTNVRDVLQDFAAVTVDTKKPISLFDFTRLVESYIRPALSDAERSQHRIFPDGNGGQPEESTLLPEARLGAHFPGVAFVFTDRPLRFDELSDSYGRGAHFIRIASHEAEQEPQRIFAQDIAHAFKVSEDEVLASPDTWKSIHEEFLTTAAKEPRPEARILLSLAYYHLTYERGYVKNVAEPEVQARLALTAPSNVIRLSYLLDSDSEGHYALGRFASRDALCDELTGALLQAHRFLADRLKVR